MRSRTQNISAKSADVLMASIICALGALSHAEPQHKPQATPPAQRAFDTADQAVQALVHAAEDYNVEALIDVLGPDSKDLIASEDPVEDKNRVLKFVVLAREKTTVTLDSTGRRAEVIVGPDAWPLPIPVVKRGGKWYFDSKAGRTEILMRRIGENELNVIEICRGFVEAQLEYAETKHNKAEVNQYAQRIISTPGWQDGLAWQNADGTWGGPVGPAAAKALEEGYSQGQPYHGYFFKVLNGQGPAARLGQMDFVVRGAMIGGFALIAAPAQYRVTGVQTFMVSHDGVVYQKDMGVDTLNIFKSLNRFNPDKTWRVTNGGL